MNLLLKSAVEWINSRESDPWFALLMLLLAVWDFARGNAVWFWIDLLVAAAFLVSWSIRVRP